MNKHRALYTRYIIPANYNTNVIRLIRLRLTLLASSAKFILFSLVNIILSMNMVLKLNLLNLFCLFSSHGKKKKYN